MTEDHLEPYEELILSVKRKVQSEKPKESKDRHE